MMPEETYELIDKYLHGALSEADRISFELRLKNDPEFNEQVELQQDAYELVIDAGVLQAKAKLQNIHKIETDKEKLWKWKIYLSGLAVALLIGAGGYYYFSYKEKNIVEVSSPEVRSSVSNSKLVVPIEKNSNSNGGIYSEKQIPASKNNYKKYLSATTVTTPVQTDDKSNVDTKESKTVSNEPFMKKDSIPKTTTNLKVDCSIVKILGEIDSKASCAHEATGAIVINLGTLKGGKKPYLYSISGEDGYGVAAQYNQLSAGQYTVKVKDQNGCTDVLATAVVESTACSKEYVFAPSRGEEWTIPVKEGLSGEIKISDRKGTIVFSGNFINGGMEAWTGLDNYGQQLPAGVYLFVITYSNGELQRGHVTILQ